MVFGHDQDQSLCPGDDSVTDIALVITAAFVASVLTFFSGFGLGTILMPVFAVWVPLELAVAMTAVVHFLNNVFKFVLVGRHAHRQVVLQFGIPAIFAALIGAWALLALREWPYFKLLMAAVIIFFVVIEYVPIAWLNRQSLVVGGLVSGFFGGLSGHQGALRSLVLSRAGLSKESFIGTGVVIACLVDLSRMAVYFPSLIAEPIQWDLVGVSTAAAFAGAYLGQRLLPKVTMASIQRLVSLGLILLAIALGAGWI